MCSKRLRRFTPDLFQVYSSSLLYVRKAAFFFIGVSPLLDGVSSQTEAIGFEAPVLRLKAVPPGLYTKPFEQARV